VAETPPEHRPLNRSSRPKNPPTVCAKRALHIYCTSSRHFTIYWELFAIYFATGNSSSNKDDKCSTDGGSNNKCSVFTVHCSVEMQAEKASNSGTETISLCRIVHTSTLTQILTRKYTRKMGLCVCVYGWSWHFRRSCEGPRPEVAPIT